MKRHQTAAPSQLKLRITQLRETHHITQRELAEVLGISYQSVSKWETGHAYPDITMLPKLSQYFGVSVDYILGLDSHKRKKYAYFFAAEQTAEQTKVLLCSFDGQILSSRRTAGTCWFYSSVEYAVGLIRECANYLAAQAEIGMEEIAFIACGASGINWEDERMMFTQVLEQKMNLRAHVFNDCTAAVFCDAVEIPNRIVLYSGAVFDAAVITPGMSEPFIYCNHTRNTDIGESIIGQRAVEAVLRAEEMLSPETSLREKVLAYFGMDSVTNLLAAYKRKKCDRSPKGLTPLVFREASEGDAVSRKILFELADDMLLYAAAAVKKYRLHGAQTAVILAGGVFRNEYPEFYSYIREKIGEICPGAEVIGTGNELADGAYHIGMEKVRELLG